MKRWIAGLFATTSLGGGALYGADQRQNPYDDKGAHYELPIKSDIPQGERVEIAKDRAAMTLKGWNDEFAITVIPQIPGVSVGADKDVDRSFKVQADRKLLSKKMEYRDGDVTAFIEPKAGSENEFDIDFTLHAEPDTNIFTYKIEGAEEFDFFYQPELTPEEIAEGAERPENVVGSYAVFHKTKANHRVGSTNYATGKAFHIYRPKAIDANGAEMWAELSYADGVLSVTAPEKWLETAAYPVVVDPTFGYTSVGASAFSLDNCSIRGGPEVLTENGDITSISFYVGQGTMESGDAGGQIATGIFDTSGNRLGVSAGTTAFTGDTANNWIVDPIALSLSAGTYDIAGCGDDAPFGDIPQFFADSVTQDDLQGDFVSWSNGGAFPGWPNPTADPGNFNRRYSIYATYTASGGGDATATPQDVILFE